jgi:hypothetical protein
MGLGDNLMGSGMAKGAMSRGKRIAFRVAFDTADDPRSAGKEMAIDVAPA